ncbi:hypothetical protein KP509_02G107800 [Ceratopteris richardii]|uniref:Uncharacterized protein n=1 Tax=Ceratopteris richardii TaxID=49495 RepID=A0A8T2VD23_CERRI|nr:hypothetical protein KP509_02G107800 [Ceratopteris richardii]KAH7445120.1 hypothetical protein KP509_02G107800 [Ceratopteris richardii]KAH7445121.1 hypothetical protein KP509_02G107800 [Ceratopteris richardii]
MAMQNLDSSRRPSFSEPFHGAGTTSDIVTASFSPVQNITYIDNAIGDLMETDVWSYETSTCTDNKVAYSLKTTANILKRDHGDGMAMDTMTSSALEHSGVRRGCSTIEIQEKPARNSDLGSEISNFSVVEGVGRTLKGRDASKMRDAVWNQIGFPGFGFLRLSASLNVRPKRAEWARIKLTKLRHYETEKIDRKWKEKLTEKT